MDKGWMNEVGIIRMEVVVQVDVNRTLGIRYNSNDYPECYIVE